MAECKNQVKEDKGLATSSQIYSGHFKAALLLGLTLLECVMSAIYPR